MYRVQQNQDMDNVGYCNSEKPAECIGEIECCEHPENFHKYLLDHGLGWQRIKTKTGLKSFLRGVAQWVPFSRQES